MNTVDALEASALPCSGAVHAEGCTPATLENDPLPLSLSRVPLEEKGAARWAYERLILYIRNFEKQLNPDQEVAMGFTGGEAGVLRIEGLGYFDPDIITFYGQDDSGLRTQLIQHVSQLNVILRALPRHDPGEPARRIGFQLSRELDTATTAPGTS